MSKLIILSVMFSAFTLGACLADGPEDGDELSSTEQHTESPPLQCTDRVENVHTVVFCLKPNGQQGTKQCDGLCTLDYAIAGVPGGFACRAVGQYDCETPTCGPCQ